ncbi:hypothetical protein AF72_02680 [Xylella taiwanensis]|uniref:Uncharacterized protein n=1 Tax=Xylella taiwanensis TaxID=1444770 RepID=Z9JMS4_9GAMM|nr:hypothetical protein AF72_02680 [Xylella taiwanensis]
MLMLSHARIFLQLLTIFRTFIDLSKSAEKIKMKESHRITE